MFEMFIYDRSHPFNQANSTIDNYWIGYFKYGEKELVYNFENNSCNVYWLNK